MIIDISYIKKVLGIEVEDSIINYLITFYFDYLCEHVNVDTTLEEEEISNDNITPSTENPNILKDNLTVFQETIIYGIACHLLKMNISITTVPQELIDEYKEYITDQDTLTYCNLFDICLKLLTDYLNDTSNVGYLRRLLDLHPNDISDNEIEFLIEHYTSYYKELMPKVDTESPLFKQTVWLSVACHIYKTRPEIIITPTEYEVDEVREEFGLAFDKFGNTWCDLADAALSDLKKQVYGYYGLRAYDRPGARTKYGYHGPTGGA